jgi:UDP-3-O-[3-hydroxymyristoyl] glucosamine N-acyltransferase
MRVAEIAAFLQARFEGDGGIEIEGVAPIESAGPGELSFVGNRKAAAAALESQAGCLLVPDEFPSGRTLIRTRDPRGAFARTIALLYPKSRPEPGIHATAVVAPDASVGESASIAAHVVVGSGARIENECIVGAGCVIGERVGIGRGSTLHANVTIYPDVRIGERRILHSGCVLGADGFGFALAGDHYEKFPQIGRVEVGDDVEIGANSCVDRAALGITRIGDGTKLDNMVHVAHNCSIGRHVVVAAQTGFSGGVVVEDYAVIGGQVGIGDKARIESRAVLGSGSGVLTSKIVRGGQVVWGVPARPLKQYLEQLAALGKLPQLREEVRELRRRLDSRGD